MDLDGLVRNYLDLHTQDLQNQKHHYENITEIEEAIDNSCLGMYIANGRTYICDHYKYAISFNDGESRWRIEDLYSARDVLISNRSEIENCVSTDFHTLYNVIGSLIIDMRGIGHLLHYDIALRIGFYLRVLPKKIYAQRGALYGLSGLYGVKSQEMVEPTIVSLDDLLTSFPQLNSLNESYIVENFLCVYDKELNRKKR